MNKAWIGIILSVVCLSSVGYRYLLAAGSSPEAAPASGVMPGPGRTSLLPRGTNPPPTSNQREQTSDDSFLADKLPFITEASFFGLIGFALGYFSRKVVKLMLILGAMLFISLQVLQYMEVVTINWQRFIDLANDLILNLKENDSIGAVLKDRIPTAGALTAGYFLGFRRG